MDVALTILGQMGGPNRIKAMIGANYLRVPNGVGIKWPSKQPSKGNYDGVLPAVLIAPHTTHTETV